MTRKALLACGILSSLLYVAMNVFVAMQWEAYSSVSQTVSELSAIDAPTRPLWMPLIAIYGLLVDRLRIRRVVIRSSQPHVAYCRRPGDRTRRDRLLLAAD